MNIEKKRHFSLPRFFWGRIHLEKDTFFRASGNFLKRPFTLPLAALLAVFFASLCLVYNTYRHETEEIAVDQDITRLTVAAYRFSEEHYHTQLEFWEYAYSPTPDRLQHFRDHELALAKRAHELQDFFARNKDLVGGRGNGERLLDKINTYYSKIQTGWNQAIELHLHGAPASKLSVAVFQAERLFDQFQLNKRINELVDVHIADRRRVAEAVRESSFYQLILNEVLFSTAIILLIIVIYMSTRRERRLLQQLVQAEKLTSLGEMSAGIAHELNNPLMYVKGFAGRVRSSLVKAGTLAPDLHDSLEEIHEGIERMSLIISHLRDFSRVSERKRTVFSASHSIGRAFDFFNEQLRLSNIRVELSLGAESDQILGSANRMEQVFINLISNARDALSGQKTEKEKKIRVESRREGARLIISFSDNGEGIPRKHLRQIFEPFFTTKPAGVGTGLGLSIVHEIIGEHAGEISVESEQGEGATFIIRLPVKSQAELDKSAA